MHKLNKTITATVLLASLVAGPTSPAHGRATGHPGDIPSVPEAWSPEGRARYTPSVPEAWSTEGRDSSAHR